MENEYEDEDAPHESAGETTTAKADTATAATAVVAGGGGSNNGRNSKVCGCWFDTAYQTNTHIHIYV